MNLSVPVQEMTCDCPAQSFTQRALISMGAKVATVSWGVFTSVPFVSTSRTLANLNLESPCSQTTADFFAVPEV
jgi:hypothetical protein